ncbi:hypothetical protein JM18_009345 [Phytophthora kernoviae]|uniref:Uncharacterized protein n=2 Tax=Phytophthora kernoviae TaxID=325452 RepID=A0A921S842_9STRA|nr:hypothetical protein G195_007087 [Phytophthora kernoviae 00238/432]KAG2502752.1 hypothetical protein JM18_009345 [Phytophthora kernoviae]
MEDKAAAAALGTVAHPLLLAEDEEGITDLELELDDTDRAELQMLASGLDTAYAKSDSVFKDHNVGDVPLARQGHILTDLVVNSYEEDVSFIYREMEAQLLRVTRHV